MKNIFKNIKFIVASAVVGLAATSCSLDMLPLNDVVLENFWTNKSDVESVVTSCYSGMQEKGYLSQLIVWGEDRSDNVVPGPDVPVALKNLMKGSLKTTNENCDWAKIYNVINRCNTVLYYAPKVAEEDPNYTTSDLNINIAEVKFIRAYSYLTLIRTFKDVPFVLEPTIDDNFDMKAPATKFEDVLDALIKDIESCKDYAPRRYTEKTFNTAKVTRAAMYSLLAELYLWKASDYKLSPAEQNESYRKCIECCDWVLNFKIQQYEANDLENEDLSTKVDVEVWSKYGYPLLAEASSSGSSSYFPAGFNETFGKGNSFESIFELTYHYGSFETINEDLGLHYGGTDANGSEKTYVSASEYLMTTPPTASTFSNVVLFSTNTDYRSIAPFRYSENGAFDIQKYAVRDVETNYRGTGVISFVNIPVNPVRANRQMYQNWIFYRTAEIMLFRAEAEIEIAGNLDKIAESEKQEEDNPDAGEGDDNEEGEGDGEEPVPGTAGAKAHKASVAVNGSTLSTAPELYDDAFNLICAVYTRSNPVVKTTSNALPSRNGIKNYDDFTQLLMNERRRELLFEGKRYFDLVRQARREGNTNKFIRALSNKYGEGGAAISIKMKQMDFMYMPILKKQIMVNPSLVQNSAYLDEEQIVNN